MSMPPHQIPEMKRVIRAIRADRARELACEALELDCARAVVARLEEALAEVFPNPPIPADPEQDTAVLFPSPLVGKATAEAKNPHPDFPPQEGSDLA